jgi:uncharacterized protein
VQCLELLVAQRCNLACTYCYGDGGRYGVESRMDERTATAAVDWLVQQSGHARDLELHFFGGEPLLEPDVIRRTVSYAIAIEEQSGKRFHFSVTTNATLLDGPTLDFLGQHGFHVVVSLDGPREIHDAQRRAKDGSGSFDRAAAGARALLARQPAAACRATLMPGTDAVAVRGALEGMGFTAIRLAPASPSLSGRGVGPGRREWSALVRLFETEASSLASAIRDRDAVRARPLLQPCTAGEWLLHLLQGEPVPFHCGVGRGLLAVSTSGDLYPCHRFVGVERFRVGSVREPAIERAAYATPPTQRMTACRRCDSADLCGGWCLHDHIVLSGTFDEPSADVCEMVRACARVARNLASSLGPGDLAFLRQEGLVVERFCPLDLGPRSSPIAAPHS